MATCAIAWTLALWAAGPPAPAAEPGSDRDPYGGWTRVTGKKTGFFHTEEIGGRWWFVTPDGNAFYSKGVDSVDISDDRNEAATKEKEPAAEAWAAETALPARARREHGRVLVVGPARQARARLHDPAAHLPLARRAAGRLRPGVADEGAATGRRAVRPAERRPVGAGLLHRQ